MSANMQICKSPQAVNELIPTLVQNKEELLPPRVPQLPCNQDFNARTRKAQRKERGGPRPPSSRRSECCTWKKGWKTSWRLLHGILEEAAAAAAPRPAPAVFPRPQSSSGICSHRESGRIRSGRSIQNPGTPVDAQIPTFPFVPGPLGSPCAAGAAWQAVGSLK